MTTKKIELEQRKIKNLRLRVERLINISQKKILDITEEFNIKVDKVYSLIEQAEENIRELRLKDLKKNGTHKEIDYDLGIDWISGKTTETVPISFKKIEDAKKYIDEEIGLEILE